MHGLNDFLPHSAVFWINHYGNIALFILLGLGIFALPIPDETLLVLAGTLIAQGKLNVVSTGLTAIVGVCCGITLSYVVGRTAGIFLIKKYGHWLHITEEKMQKVNRWFEYIGRWALFVGYFIPGVRHLTGYAAGISRLNYYKFALYSYSGATLWAITFLSIGYFLGNQWVSIMDVFNNNAWVIAFIIIGLLLLLCIATYVGFRWKNKMKHHLR